MSLRNGQRWYDGSIVHLIGQPTGFPIPVPAVKNTTEYRYTKCGEIATKGTRVPRGAPVTCLSCISDAPVDSIKVKLTIPLLEVSIKFTV